MLIFCVIKWGFIQWAQSVRSRPGRPLDDAETLYNNRTLRFWRLSTDYGRFLKDEDGVDQGGVDNANDDDTVYDVVDGGKSFHHYTQRVC